MIGYPIADAEWGTRRMKGSCRSPTRAAVRTSQGKLVKLWPVTPKARVRAAPVRSPAPVPAFEIDIRAAYNVASTPCSPFQTQVIWSYDIFYKMLLTRDTKTRLLSRKTGVGGCLILGSCRAEE